MGKFKAIATLATSLSILAWAGCGSPNHVSFASPPSTPPTSSNPGTSNNGPGGGSGGGSSSGGSGSTASATLSASATSLNFGTVNLGSTASQQVTLTNSGSAAATISGVSVTGSGSYSVSGIAKGTSIAAGAAATATVTFTPQNPGPLTATISIASNATNSPASIAVSGTGATPPPPPPGPGSLSSINHIIFLSMENRSFDAYFGKLNEYRARLGVTGDKVNGLPDDCSSTNSDWTVPCSASNDAPDASGYPTTPVYAFHLQTACIENTSADWTASHWAFNALDPNSDTPKLDGFAISAASAAHQDCPATGPCTSTNNYPDLQGIRAMGFYTSADLEYHYWLATEFATSDTWFAPAPVKTEPNRYYMVGATSGGHAYQLVTGESTINSKTIFDELNAAGISWKIYYQKNSPSAAAFSNFAAISAGHLVQDDGNFSQFISDATNGTLPAVAYIENPDADEHPGTGFNIETGVALSQSLVNAVMYGPSWKDSAFIITFDEGGGLYDHVPPPTNVVNPDGLQPVDICTNQNDSRCSTAGLTHGAPPYDPMGDFTRYGFRVPLMVVSPYTKPGYVSHVQTDYTAWLKFVEKRFNLPSLTARDAAASDMTDFFDFQNPHWLTPPPQSSVPAIKNLPCHNTLP